ncbi:nose resistant to fluoxetine protein 6 [Drosophila navojoa]|nr:nose resistant to fluoxetine protein 6 [Drosophila navojoa]
MGSLALCEAIYDSASSSSSSSGNNTKGNSSKDNNINTANGNRNNGLPFAEAYAEAYSSVYNPPPPFMPGFYVLKLQLNETMPTQMLRTIYMGVCLPSTCSIADVHRMSSYARQELPSRELRVLDIRVPTDTEFNIWSDKTFCLLIVVSCIVLGLICCGTLYEIYLTRKLKEALRLQDKEMMNNSETSSGIGCASSDYSDTMTAHEEALKQSNQSGSLKQLDQLVLHLPPSDNDSGNGHHHEHDHDHDHDHEHEHDHELEHHDHERINVHHHHHHSHHHRHHQGVSIGSGSGSGSRSSSSGGGGGVISGSGNKSGNNNNNSNSDEHLEGHLHEPEKLSIYSELLLSFSAITNFNAICDRNVGADTIPCIHGLRAFSMAWVILGHTCIVVFKYSDNMEMRKEVEQNFFFQAITNGPFSVDTFFFISGFLISYLYFRTNAKGKLNKLSKGANEFTAGTAHFFGLVAYRFMRLTAPYLFVLGVVQVTMRYLAAYSIFDPPTMDHVTCPDYWWRNILYINTLFPVDEMCMLWSWYLANDTQFYMIGAIILIVGVRHFKLSAITTLVFLVLSWITTAVIAFTNNHRPNTDDPLALFDKIYDKPWTRLGPYLIGMAVGWILFRTNCKIRLPRLTVATAWTLAMLNLFVLVFGLYRADLSQFTAAAYSSLSHSAWALSLAWITIACSTGYGGYINSLLSAPCFYPFSRVTYCAYLVHPIVIRSMALNSDAPLHLGGDLMVVMFFGLTVASYFLSFVVSMSFEAPVVTMLKILSPSRKKRLA